MTVTRRFKEVRASQGQKEFTRKLDYRGNYSRRPLKVLKAIRIRGRNNLVYTTSSRMLHYLQTMSDATLSSKPTCLNSK